MALALNHQTTSRQTTTRQHVRPARHLHLVPELDPTPVGAYRPASRPGSRPVSRPAARPAARRSAQHPSLATTATNTASVATYQRRRLVVLVAAMLILGVVIAGVIGVTGTTAQADQAVAGQSIEPRTVIAQPGDTLWAIAKRVAPQANVSDLVDQLVRINGDAIVAGQVVRIP
jgi:nucleoid-associated protein YgaU